MKGLLLLTLAMLLAPLPSLAQQARQITQEERVYIASAGGYLKTVNKQSLKVAKVMAGARDGSSTLSDIKRAIEEAKFVESAAFLGDYQEHVHNVPKNFARNAANVAEVHRLFQAAMKEFLEYWKDQNTEHINSGNLTFERSARLANATVSEANQLMKGLTK